MKTLALSLAFCVLIFAQEETPDKRLRHSTETFREIMATPDGFTSKLAFSQYCE